MARVDLDIVGRAAELAAVRSVHDRASHGPAVLAVAGDPGIGKTRLLDELAAHAARAGRTVLTARAAEFERQVPFGIIKNALEDHVAAMPADRLGDLGLLASIFPALAAPRPGAVADLLAAERYRLHRAVRALAERVAEPAGLVLILDDLHWCDEGSAELLGHLLRHPPQAAVLVALAYRPRQLSPQLHQALLAAMQRGLAGTVEVGPLPFADAAALLPAGLDPAERLRVYEASAGNPFYLQVLARAGSGAGAMPVRAALAAEFAALDAGTQRVAHAAAVAGDVFDPALVAAIAAEPEPAVLDALDALSGRDLVRAARASGAFGFRHPLLRSAAYHDAQPGWRVAAHGRAAAELARRGASPAERAAHLELSATPGDLDAVQVLRDAATDAMHTIPTAAAGYLESALRLLPNQPATMSARLGLLDLRARALGITGRLAESRDILEELLRMAPAGSDGRVTVVTFLTMIEHLLGNHAHARALLLRELAALSDLDGRSAATLRVALVTNGILHRRVDTADIAEAVEVARGTGDRPLLASALGVGAVASHSFDAVEPRAAAWLAEAGELVDAMPVDEVAQRLDAVLFLGWGEVYAERYAAAGRHIQLGLRAARATGQSHLVGSLQMLSGAVHCMTGELDLAETALDDALEAAVLTGSTEALGRVRGYQASVALWRGDVAESMTLAEESMALAGGQLSDWQSGPAAVTLGWARYALGDPDGCRDLLLKMGRGPGLPAIRDVWKPRWLECLSAAAVAAGHRAEAVEVRAHARNLSTVDELPRRTGFLLLAQAHPLVRTQPAEAARLAAAGAAAFARAGDRIGAAQAYLHCGVARRAAGDQTGADREFARARQAFAACGARPAWLAAAAGISLDPGPEA